MSNPPSQTRISRRTVLLGGTLSLAASAFLSIPACVPPPKISVKFLYSTEKDLWLQEAIDAFQRTNPQFNGKQIEIIPLNSGSLDIVDKILEQGDEYIDLVACSPASELELNRLDYLWNQNNHHSLINYSVELGPRSLVQSPFVFAVWEQFAGTLLNAYGYIDWDTIYMALQLPNGWNDLNHHQDWGTQIHLGQTLPTASNSGLLAITLMANAYLKQKNKPLTFLDYQNVFESHVNVYGTSSGPYWDHVIEMGAAQYAIIFTYENLVLKYGQTRSKKQPQMEMFYPAQNILSDHQFAILDNTTLATSGQLQEQQQAAKIFRDFLRGDDQQKAALSYGFRRWDHSQSLVDPGKDNPFDQLQPTGRFSLLAPDHTLDTPINVITAPSGDVVDTLIKQWHKRYQNPQFV